jgi:hypothetical protein
LPYDRALTDQNNDWDRNFHAVVVSENNVTGTDPYSDRYRAHFAGVKSTVWHYTFSDIFVLDHCIFDKKAEL